MTNKENKNSTASENLGGNKRRKRNRYRRGPKKNDQDNVQGTQGAAPDPTADAAPVDQASAGQQQRNAVPGQQATRGNRRRKVKEDSVEVQQEGVNNTTQGAADANQAVVTKQRKRNNRRQKKNSNAKSANGETEQPQDDDSNNIDEPAKEDAATSESNNDGKVQNKKMNRRQRRRNGKPARDNKQQMGVEQSDSLEKDPAVRTGNKRAGRNTESLDPSTTFVRPSLRVYVSSANNDKYSRPFKHDDVVIVNEMFGKEDDMTIYDKLVSEIKNLQNGNVKGSELTSWHQGAHKIVKDPTQSKTFNEVVDKLCEYFHVKKDTIFTRLNWYEDSKDWKPYHHDSAAFNKERAKKQNITVGVSFGACRELAFLKTNDEKEGNGDGDEFRIYFPQPNNGVFTFGRDVNIRFKHGINALPECEQDEKGRISILLWGWTLNVIEEKESPAMVEQNNSGSPAKEAAILERRRAKNARRNQKRTEQRKAFLAAQKNEDTPSGQGNATANPEENEAVVNA